MSAPAATRPRPLKPTLGEVLLGLAGALAATTLVASAAAAVTLRGENRQQR